MRVVTDSQATTTPPQMPGTPGSGPPEEGRRGGCLLYVAGVGLWFFVLNDFFPWQGIVPLVLLGPALAYWGLYLSVAGLRWVFESPFYAAAWICGPLMTGAAGLTLAPGLPGDLLASTGVGWVLLDLRTDELDRAMQAGDVSLVRKIARRGLGDPAPQDSFGNPLLHLAEGQEMVMALLDAGLDPDARNSEGRTLLMRTSEPELVRQLLAAGADPNARDRNGATVLMRRGDDPVETIELLLEAGADVHGMDDGGRTAADLVRGPGRALLERYAGGRPLVESGDLLVRGRDEWLLAPGQAPSSNSSSLSLEPPMLRPGELGTLSIELANASPTDRVLDIRAQLNDAILLVGASHDAAREGRGRAGSSSTVRWPLLALPSERRGRLELQVLARPDDTPPEVPPGDWSVDVRILDLPQRTEEVLQHYQERQGEPARMPLASGMSWLAALIPPGLGLIAWLWWRRRGQELDARSRRFRMGREAAAFVSLVCLGLVVGQIWSMVESRGWQEASCQVLDYRVLTRQVTGTRITRTGSPTTSSRPTIQSLPVASFEIMTAAGRRITAGSASGLPRAVLRDLQTPPWGAAVSCWFDPNDTSRVTLTRTTPVSGIVGVAILLVVTFIAGTVAIRLGRGGTGNMGA